MADVPFAKIKVQSKTIHKDRVLGALALITLVAAWFIGSAHSQAAVEPFLKAALPGAKRFELRTSGVYAAYQDTGESNSSPIAYVAVGEANGYGGPMRLAVATDLEGNIIGVAVIDQKETPTFFKRVMGAKLLEDLFGRSFAQPLTVGQDIDAVTGASYTSRALVDSIRQASRQVAVAELKLSAPPAPHPTVKFGIPEMMVIVLFAVGYIGHKPKFKYKKLARWLSMLAGLFVLGFVFNLPLTLGKVNSFMMGYWPQWQTNLYWYLLLGGILFVFTVDNKNPYCEWFCPFGAAQECMGAIGGAKPRTPNQYRNWINWVPRTLAWLAILIALIFRNPGLSSYEIFGNLFSLTGSTVGFILLGTILLASLYIRRPWCNYLCPLRPVIDFIRMVRGWILDLWKK